MSPENRQKASISIRSLRKAYGDLEVLKDVNLTLNAGEVVCVIGPSGSGKSTLLRCISGLEQADGGTMELPGTKRVGLVFQDFNLFGNLNVVDNIAYAPRRINGLSRRAAMRKAVELLRDLGLESRARSIIGELSGGERQRVAIARTLAMQPDVLLLDEPTSALDPQRIIEIAAVISDLQRKGMPMLVVTHDLAFARRIATRCVLLQNGVVYDSFSVEMRQFLHRANVLQVTAKSRGFDFYGFLGHLAVCNDHSGLSQSMRQELRLVLEELLLNLVLPRTDEISIEVDTTSPRLRGGFSIVLKWMSDCGDPFGADDPDVMISERIISGYCTYVFSRDEKTSVNALTLVSKRTSLNA